MITPNLLENCLNREPLDNGFYDYHKHVPKDLLGNLCYRKAALELARESKEAQAVLRLLCKRDTLYWFHVFAWTHNPKNVGNKSITGVKIPFILYPYQEQLILTLEDIIFGDHEFDQTADILKSRIMGVSWICLGLAVKHWNFEQDFSILAISRKEEYVDKPGDKKALFQRMEYLIQMLPGWMCAKKDWTKTKLCLSNKKTGSEIIGESTTGNAGRGDRRAWVFVDEFGAFDVTASYEVMEALGTVARLTIFNSTYGKVTNAFDDVTSNDNNIHIRCHWSLHPDFKKGLYTSKNGALEILDKKYKFPANYEFVCDGVIRSPYRDHYEKRFGKKAAARELDMDRDSARDMYYEECDLEGHAVKFCSPPFHTGKLTYEYESLTPTGFLEQSRNWDMRLWFALSQDNAPNPRKRFVVACDISGGTGATPSTAGIFDELTYEQVGEVYARNMHPGVFADYIYMVCKWFNNAYLIWENNGPGRTFSKEIVERIQYRNIYMEEIEDRIAHKKTEKPGWNSSSVKKQLVHDDFIRAINENLIIIRCKELLEECRQFTFDSRGGPVHSKTLNKENMAESGENHADRVVYGVLAWKALSRYNRHKEKNVEQEELDPPVGSIAWMYREIEYQENAEDLGLLQWQ